jgi:hypothetical protein
MLQWSKLVHLLKHVDCTSKPQKIIIKCNKYKFNELKYNSKVPTYHAPFLYNQNLGSYFDLSLQVFSKV